MTLHDRRFGDNRPALLLLFGAVGVLLLIACANVSSLLLARAARRQREFAVRIAVGATRGRLVRYLVCESLVLSVAGGLLGLGVAIAAVRYFVSIGPAWIANVENIRVDGGGAPLHLRRLRRHRIRFGSCRRATPAEGILAPALAGGNARATHTARQNHLRRALVVAELATALMLLTGAGLLTNSFARAIAVDPGFRPQRLLAARLDLAALAIQRRSRGCVLQRDARARAGLPGVESATLAAGRPPTSRGMTFTINENGNESPRINVTAVGDGYVETIGATLGRTLHSPPRMGPMRRRGDDQRDDGACDASGPEPARAAHQGGRKQSVAIVGVMRGYGAAR
jgi:putative ABC transport system permease protein